MNLFGKWSKSEATCTDAQSTFLVFLRIASVYFTLNLLANLDGWMRDWKSTSSAYRLLIPSNDLLIEQYRN
jgi:hypothetical protein